MLLLNDRKIIEISGQDRYKFLQGLITNDIYKSRSDNLIYSAMLNAKGRFLYDFFIFSDESKIYLDCYQLRVDEIIAKLKLYKLRSKIDIVRNDKMLVAFIEKDLECNLSAKFFAEFFDPRCKDLGKRVYFIKNEATKEKYISDQSQYHKLRINNKIAEGEYDLTYEKSLILEFAFDDLNAVNYDKGCYVGQELTARTHHLGQIRKKIYIIEIANISQIFSEKEIKKVANQTNLLKNSELIYNNNVAGIILSSIIEEDKIIALALIKDLEGKFDNNLLSLTFKEHPVKFR